MQDIQKVVNDQVSQMIKNGDIEKVIQEGVQKSIESAIRLQFESYGSVTKQLNKAIEEGLKINVKDIPFESYTQQMGVAVKTKLGSLFAEQASSRFLSEIDSLLALAPTEITITELVNAIASSWKTDEPWDADDLDEYATVEVKPWVHGGQLAYTLNMWKKLESYSGKNTADLQLFISDNKIRIGHKQSYNPTCFSEHEAYIFKLYSAGTIITVPEDFDADDCDLTLKEAEY